MTAPTQSQSQLSELFQLGRYHDLVAVARGQAVTPESDPMAAQLLAASLFRIGEFAAAAPLLEGLEPAFGLNPDFLSLFGANNRRLGKLDQAEELFKRALQLNPTSAPIRNNYANLLIDLARYQEAREILTALLQENSDYNDAKVNLNRLEFEDSRQTTSPASATENVEGWSLADPLLLAFSEEEVRHSGLRKSSAVDPAAAKLVDSLPKPEERSVALEQLEQATDAVSQKQFTLALQLCSQVHRVLGAYAPLYDCVSDIYLNLRRFHESEICLMQALNLDGPSPKRCLNLVSFASMRGDFTLAQYHLQQAASLDPSHPQLASIRSSLARRHNSGQDKPYAFLGSWEPAPLTQQSS